MITTNQIHWAAGFLEGEACFSSTRHSPRIAVSQVQRFPLTRLKDLFGGTITAHFPKEPYAGNRQFRWYIGSVHALGIMMTIYTLLSPKRQGQIEKALALWKKHKKRPGLRTHCPYGHTYTPQTLDRRKDGKVSCRVCRYDRQNRKRAAHPEKYKKTTIGPRRTPLIT